MNNTIQINIESEEWRKELYNNLILALDLVKRGTIVREMLFKDKVFRIEVRYDSLYGGIRCDIDQLGSSNGKIFYIHYNGNITLFQISSHYEYIPITREVVTRKYRIFGEKITSKEIEYETKFIDTYYDYSQKDKIETFNIFLTAINDIIQKKGLIRDDEQKLNFIFINRRKAICDYCGADLRPSDSTCRYCGRTIKW